MFGWRARIGLVSPGTSGIHTTAIELEMLAPEGVLLVSRFLDGPRSLALADLRAMQPQIESAARELAALEHLDVILVAGAPIVLANGSAAIIAMIEKATGRPATTNVAAIAHGLRRLGVARVVLVTPYYPQEVVDLVQAFLEGEGIEIVSLVGGPSVDFGRHKDISPQQTYRTAKQAILAAPSAEGLVIVGGGAPLHEVIGVLETDTGKPVVANNFAAMWDALTLANVREPIPGYGRLLTLF